jgi:hypothetical protein
MPAWFMPIVWASCTQQGRVGREGDVGEEEGSETSHGVVSAQALASGPFLAPVLAVSKRADIPKQGRFSSRRVYLSTTYASCSVVKAFQGLLTIMQVECTSSDAAACVLYIPHG